MGKDNKGMPKVPKYDRVCATCYESKFFRKLKDYRFVQSHLDLAFRNDLFSCMISKGYSLREHAEARHSIDG